MGGARLRERIGAVLRDLDLSDRARDFVQTLSVASRVEPSSRAGSCIPRSSCSSTSRARVLDPGARRDFGQQLRSLRDGGGVTIVLTTHYMEEAERADRVAVLHDGVLVALGTPDD